MARIKIERVTAGRLPAWRIFCTECGHDYFHYGALVDAYHHAEVMAFHHFPYGATRCPFWALYARDHDDD